MLLLLTLATTVALTTAYYQIEDIPIEHFNFDHGDLQNNAMDIELMPRFQKSIHISETSDDPKEYFFRSSYSQYGDSYFDSFPTSEYSEEVIDSKERKKREVESETESSTSVEGIDVKSIVTTLGKPLELAVIDPEEVTEKSEEGVIVAAEKDEDTNFLINDFIRFRRSAETERMSQDVEDVKKLMKDIDEKNKSKSDPSEKNPKSLVEELESPHTEQLIMNHREDDRDEVPRGARGATKQEWVKQVYPVRRREPFEDNAASPAENEMVRAPRVHFVTQGMSESSPRPEYNRYDREARARNLNKELAWNLDRDPYRDMMYQYQPRFTRNYVPPPPYSNYRSDRYNNYDLREPWDDYSSRSRYRDYPERPYDKYNSYNTENSNNNYSGTKGRQRRIIYYATLPDISRTPPNVNLRDKYDYRDRYENRYFSPDPSYQMRKPYTKLRYEENDRKPQYPLKVSTDVNVREVKKNPEGRIYSEVDRNRFPQNTNYRNERA